MTRELRHHDGSGTVFAAIRASAATVAERARLVRIDGERLERLAVEMAYGGVESPQLDPAHHYTGDAASTLAFVVTLDAINFGSGWFPFLAKRSGCSGYFTIAHALKERFEAHGPWSARELADMNTAACSAVLGQDPSIPEMSELMQLFATSLRDLGVFLDDRFDGDFRALVEDAGGRAERLVERLAEMPSYRDVSRYEELEVPFYKRAQITVTDLALAFGGKGVGRFDDIDALTIFADNLVPHVLRHEGVLHYEEALATRIESGELLEAGSPEEVEIRAVALHAVERMSDHCERQGTPMPARRLDLQLWSRGQRPDLKARPRHRTRSVYY